MSYSATHTWKFGIGAVVLLCLLLLGARYVGKPAHAEEAGELKFQWLLPHQPYEVFTAALQKFDSELKNGSNGRMSLDKGVTLSDVGLAVNAHSGMLFLDRGGPKIVPEYIDHLSQYDSRLQGLKLPYLFDNYDEALAFLDGPKAQILLDAVSDKTSYKALAFTMSGGLKIMVSRSKKIQTPEDMHGMVVLSISDNDVTKSIMNALGASVIRDENLETTPDVEKLKTADAVETTYTRLGAIMDAAPWFPKYVTETYHGLALTVLMVSDDFYNSLTPEDQKALVNAAHQAAIVEKHASIDMAQTMKARLEKAGGTVITLTPEQKDAFKAATLPVRQALDKDYPLVLDAVNSK